MAKETYAGSPSTKSYAVALLVFAVVAAGIAALQNFQSTGYAAVINSLAADKTAVSQGESVMFTSSGYSSVGRNVKIICSTEYNGRLTGLCQSDYTRINPYCRWSVPTDFAAGTYDVKCFLREATTYTRSESRNTQIIVVDKTTGGTNLKLTNLYANPPVAVPGQSVVFSSETSSSNNRMMKLQCGISPSSSNVCTSANLMQSNPTCYRIVPYTWSGTTKTVYCRVFDDTGMISKEKNVSVTILQNATSAQPVLTSLAANPSTTQAGQTVEFRGIGSSSGKSVTLQCGLFPGSKNVCAGSSTFTADPSCSVVVPNSWTSSTKTVYCRLVDSAGMISSEIVTTVTISGAANTTAGPRLSSLTAEPLTVKPGYGLSLVGRGTYSGSAVNFECGLNPGANNVCSAGGLSSSSFSCSTTVPNSWSNSRKNIYCRITDSSNRISNELSVAVSVTNDTASNDTKITKPVLTSVSADPPATRQGLTVTFKGYGTSPAGRTVQLQCGLSPGSSNVCEGTLTYNNNPICSVNVPKSWTSTTKTIYCRIKDSARASSDDKSTAISVVSGPLLSSLSVNPIISKVGQNSTVTGTGDSPGKKVKLVCGTSSGLSNICQSTSYTDMDPMCSKMIPTTWLGLTKNVYCRTVDESGIKSNEMNVTVNVA